MASTTSPLPSAEHPPSTHKRTYQACIPCRQRKVRCDLGPVDDPHKPPCVRCRREKKDCFFTETRRKRKAEEEGARDLSDDFVARNRRSTLDRSTVKEDGTSGSQDESTEHELYDQVRADGGVRDGTEKKRTSLQLSRAASWNPSTRETKTTPEGREVTNETAAVLLIPPIHNPGDALNLLVDAASRSEDLDRQRNQAQPNILEPYGNLSRPLHKAPGSANDASAMAIDPAIANATGSDRSLKAEGLEDALRAWSRFRFVRAGWLTAPEAISYLDYFYLNLAPLTPIVPPSYHALSSHAKLLTEEPVLTITLLTIASRYMILKGPAGQSRSFLIHERLWKFLRGMITRMFWGQEQFGGGFCGAGSAGKEQRPGMIKGGLRSLGTIESLLLLSDWHPRSMHFPPGDDGDEIITPLFAEAEDIEPSVPALSGSPYLTWTEPASRSDKMCWSLVGFAYTLSYELGVFNSLIENGRWYPLLKTGHDGYRASCIGRLLHIYVSQTCGRLGYPNIMPHEGTDTNIEFLRMDLSNGTPNMSEYDQNAENVQRAWAEITALMRQSNAEMFESRSLTREKIQNGEYLQFLQAYWPKLREWLDKFETINIPPLSKTLLMMEYEYTRTYVNSLSLQAVLEQCANTSDETTTSATARSKDGHTPPALLSSKIVDLYKENAVYIAEVVDASRNLLRHVVQGLVPRNGLKHAPVRTYFRILSGAMFLLKTFALGAKEEEIARSLKLLEDTVKALRKNVVDDVHLILRIADLLGVLTSSIRTKFKRLPVHGRSNNRQPTHHSRKASQAAGKTAKIASPTNDNNRFANSRPLGPDSNQINLDYLGTQGSLAGKSTDLVDPNDSTIAIMPPPDYIYTIPYPQTDNSSPLIYSNPISPHQQYSNVQQPHQQFSPSQQDLQQQRQMQQNGAMFAPSNADYDWLTLDVNPLLQQGQGGGGQGMGTGSWAGAFGPDIGESLELLNILTDLGQYGFGPGG